MTHSRDVCHPVRAPYQRVEVCRVAKGDVSQSIHYEALGFIADIFAGYGSIFIIHTSSFALLGSGFLSLGGEW